MSNEKPKERRVPTLEELEKEVRRLNRKLRDEKDKTRAMEKRVRRLTAEINEIRQALNLDPMSPSVQANRSSRMLSPSSDPASGRPRSVSMEDEALRRKEREQQQKDSAQQAQTPPQVQTSQSPPQPSSSNSEFRKMAGWLERRIAGPKKEGKTEAGEQSSKWQRVWVTLDERRLTIYKTDKEDEKNKITWIPLTNSLFFGNVEKGGKLKPMSFNIRLHEKDFLFRVKNGNEKSAWAQSLKAVCRPGTLTPEEQTQLEKVEGAKFGKVEQPVQRTQSDRKSVV